MWFPSFFAFESVSKPSYFIRHLPEEELVIDKYDGTKDFKEDASFQLSKKPDASMSFLYLIHKKTYKLHNNVKYLIISKQNSVCCIYKSYTNSIIIIYMVFLSLVFSCP